MDEKQEHEHIWEDRWYPLDKFHVRKRCVYPGCTEVTVKEVK